LAGSFTRLAANKNALAAGLLAVLAAALYWPIGTWFQGDDFIAITHAWEWARVGDDFLGPQYGLTGHTLFWRPLITLSFALEARLFGADPFGYHLSNALVHGLNSLLLLLVLCRLLGWPWALRAACLWALHPAHALPVLWTVGRVDLHCSFWMLLALLLELVRRERPRAPSRAARAGALAAFAAALATKELAMTLPALVGLAVALAAIRGGRPWLRPAVCSTLPYAALLAPYLLLRRALLGQALGGYMAESILWPEVPGGLAVWTGQLLLPAATELGRRVLGSGAPWIAAAGGALWLLLMLRGAAARGAGALRAGIGGGLLWYLASAAVLLSFLPQHSELKHLRYFYLPLAGLMILGAAGGWRPALLLALLALPVHLPVRADFMRAFAYDRAVQRNLLALAPSLDPERPAVIEEPRATPGIAVELFLGLERLLAPPFGPGRPILLRWRPFLPPEQEPYRIAVEESGLPIPDYLRVEADGSIRRLALPARELERFELGAEPPGAIDGPRLARLAYDPAADIRLVPSPARPGRYRVLLLTDIAYLPCVVDSEPDGTISLRRILLSPTTPSGRWSLVYQQRAMSLDVAPTLAAYALAVQTGRPFVYIENQRSRLARYGFEDGGPVLQSSQELPALIDAGDYLNAHLPGFAVEGYSRDEKGRLSEGGQFEAAVHQALASRLDEVLAGVRPAGVASQIEIDLVLRCGNAVGIAEVKLGGGDSGKRGLDQLKMEGESTYLGAYTSQFLITAAFKLRDPIRTLAYKRGVHIIQIPNYKPGQPLSRPDADRLAREIRQVLNP